MDQNVSNFNLRVYGLLIVNESVLVTDEHRGVFMTKFPGGGLEKGEGIADCLKREFMEEAGVVVTVKDHFYVNDFLQISAFDSKDQLISFYYRVETAELENIEVIKEKIDLKRGDQVFRWVAIKDLREAAFNFPIDQKVVSLLKRGV